mgnify:FL=1
MLFRSAEEFPGRPERRPERRVVVIDLLDPVGRRRGRRAGDVDVVEEELASLGAERDHEVGLFVGPMDDDGEASGVREVASHGGEDRVRVDRFPGEDLRRVRDDEPGEARIGDDLAPGVRADRREAGVLRPPGLDDGVERVHGGRVAVAPGGPPYDGPMPSKVLLAAPRGYCAGVDRAVEAVEEALAAHGAPVYVRKQIVHNLHVVRDLESKGAIFVEEETEVPEGAVVVLSAHGVAPEVYGNARVRNLTVLDATCPLVTKVHLEARRFAQDDKTIVLIGHAGHEEVVGTTGQAPERTVLVQTVEEARRVELPVGARPAYLTQTTLSVDETNEIVAVLKERFPTMEGPPRDDICYATQNRQDAIKIGRAHV